MAALKHFDEIIAWRNARQLTKVIYEMTREHPVASEYGFKDQLQRASVSVMSNIAEGFGYRSNKQFLKYLSISRASLCEVQSLLYVALDAKLISREKFEALYDLSRKTVVMIAALQKALN